MSNRTMKADEMAKLDKSLEWFIAIGNSWSWGRARNVRQAIRLMNDNAVQRIKPTKYQVFAVTKDTYVNDMGGLTRPTADHEPVVVKNVEPKPLKLKREANPIGPTIADRR